MGETNELFFSGSYNFKNKPPPLFPPKLLFPHKNNTFPQVNEEIPKKYLNLGKTFFKKKEGGYFFKKMHTSDIFK